MCVRHSKLGRVKDPVLRLDMITGGENLLKISERLAVSCGVNPEIHGSQIHKHTELGKHKLISGTVQWILIYKTKRFFFEKKNSHQWTIMTVWFFTLGICICEGVGEDSRHGIG